MTVARITHVNAGSPTSFHDAIQEGLNRAKRSIHGITGLEILAQKAKVENGNIVEYRVEMQITFILD